MLHIVKQPKFERETLFRNTAQKCGISDGIAEKDFWVCFALDYLFGESPWKNHLAFKGGTSLSKCFGLIERFSEDIDVILDWRLLGITNEESWAKRSRTQQDKFNKELIAKTETFLASVFLPKMQEDLSQILNEEFTLYIDTYDPQTICFSYPRSFDESAILPLVRLEIGALAAWTPVQTEMVTSYAATQYPQLFSQPSVHILTVAPQRTFWEKVTILHKEAFRTNGQFPSRYSRHYYDLYRMANSPIKEQMLQDLELLEQVVKFKDRFYPAGSAHYELAKIGFLRLIPPQDCMETLRNDYEHMKNMLFGEVPEFEEIMKTITALEREINMLGQTEV